MWENVNVPDHRHRFWTFLVNLVPPVSICFCLSIFLLAKEKLNIAWVLRVFLPGHWAHVKGEGDMLRIKR